MLLDSSRWIFLKYQIFVIFSTRLLKKCKFKIMHWHTWHSQLGQVTRDERRSICVFQEDKCKSNFLRSICVFQEDKCKSNFLTKAY